MRPLEATVEQNGAFWVRFDVEGDYVNKCLKWTGSNIEHVNCDAKLTVVCHIPNV